MKRKYYLRGLGLGILITSLVFIFTGPSELSDEEIIKRAEKLGYTKAGEITPSIGLKDLLETGTPEPTKAPELTQSPVPSMEPSITPTATVTPTVLPTVSPTPVPTPTNLPSPTLAPTSTPMPTATPTQAPTATPSAQKEVITAVISVEKGNTATVVCNKIEEAGIVENGKVLRTYLINHNLTDYINVGKYTLSSDMTIEEIAEIITER